MNERTKRSDVRQLKGERTANKAERDRHRYECKRQRIQHYSTSIRIRERRLVEDELTDLFELARQANLARRLVLAKCLQQCVAIRTDKVCQ